jgi:hypothetical protein
MYNVNYQECIWSAESQIRVTIENLWEFWPRAQVKTKYSGVLIHIFRGFLPLKTNKNWLLAEIWFQNFPVQSIAHKNAITMYAE